MYVLSTLRMSPAKHHGHQAADMTSCTGFPQRGLLLRIQAIGVLQLTKHLQDQRKDLSQINDRKYSKTLEISFGPTRAVDMYTSCGFWKTVDSTFLYM